MTTATFAGPWPQVRRVAVLPRFYHVEFRAPARFRRIRTPDWAQKPAQRYAPGALVKTGQLRSSGAWKLQSVLIPREIRAGVPRSLEDATAAAWRIMERIETNGG